MKLVGELTQQQLKSVIRYIPICGLFLYTENYPGKKRGTVVGTTVTNMYTHISIYGKKYKAHRLAWLYVYGKWPEGQIDHIDGDPSNNRIDNLRLATQSQNNRNKKMSSNNTSGAKGVSRIGSRFQAQITVAGKRRYLGTFGTLNEAADAYKTAAEKYFGEFARPEVGQYKPPSLKKKVLCAERRKRPIDAMSHMAGVRRGPL
jgi:hypothetical protein